MLNIWDEIQKKISSGDGRPALAAPGRETLGYGELLAQVYILSRVFSRMGIRPGDAVAVAIPEGTEAIAAILAVMRTAVCSPLNPALRENEFASALTKMRARLLIVLRGSTPEAKQAARRINLPVLELVIPENAPAGSLASGELPEFSSEIEKPWYAPETALLLFTSATTQRPKLVPITHAQFSAMVASMRTAYPAADNGRSLILAPHFHLQCLLSVFVQLFSGGMIIAPGGFDINAFAGWMREFKPTHYSVNPTLHRAILGLCPADADGVLPIFKTLRFVTSSGALLSDELRDELESRLGVPVIEGYGLTEAGRVTMTPVDPASRRPGSVGFCYGIELEITDEEGARLPVGAAGEIVLRGETVISGYAFDPEANATAFRDGWFRTGDMGRLDSDGFLYLTGRIKESINRGAEKILPYEIEEVLTRHPAVREAAVFGYPHPRLGEDLGACIVKRAATTPADIRHFAAQYLAEYKIPRLMVFAADIPKGPTGKIQRTRLAEILNVSGRFARDPASGQPPLDAIETQIAELWGELLGVNPIGRGDDFFLLGGDSLLAVRMIVRLEEKFKCGISTGILVASATLESVAESVRKIQSRSDDRGKSCLVALREGGRRKPIFFVHALDGRLLPYRFLIDHLGSDFPAFGFEARGLQAGEKPDTTIGGMAKNYLCSLRSVQACGPYWLGGYSMGGLIALEMARLLIQNGERVNVILIDTQCLRENFSFRMRMYVDKMKKLSWKERMATVYATSALLAGRILPLKRGLSSKTGGAAAPETGRTAAETPYQKARQRAIRTYQLRPVSVDALLLWCHLDDSDGMRTHTNNKWRKLISGELHIRNLPGTHTTIVREPYVRDVASEIIHYISDVENKNI